MASQELPWPFLRVTVGARQRFDPAAHIFPFRAALPQGGIRLLSFALGAATLPDGDA
jgi:hypothetical protein